MSSKTKQEEVNEGVGVIDQIWKIIKLLFWIEVFLSIFIMVYLGLDGMMDIGCLMMDPRGEKFVECEVIDLPKPIEHAIVWLWGNLQSASQFIRG